MSKQVKETYYCHFARRKLNLLCFISKAYEFFNPFSVSLALAPPLFFSVFYVLLLSQCNSASLSVSRPPDCIIRTCHFFSGGVNLERLWRAHPGENPGNLDQGGGGLAVKMWTGYFEFISCQATEQAHLRSTSEVQRALPPFVISTFSNHRLFLVRF